MARNKKSRKSNEDNKLNVVKGRSDNQKAYLKSINDNKMTFCVGPAGTGKTYLAIHMAAQMLQLEKVSKIVLCRPVVPAGEDLGFLPGDVREKLDPYLRPLYDAFRDFLEPGQLKAYLDEETIEISPLSYMRGRTFNNSVIVLDEAQNSTVRQMKLFLTRMGRDSKMIINGDVTQIDLDHVNSGLIDACQLLQNVPGIGWAAMNNKDICRDSLVQKIVQVYEQREVEAHVG